MNRNFLNRPYSLNSPPPYIESPGPPCLNGLLLPPPPLTGPTCLLNYLYALIPRYMNINQVCLEWTEANSPQPKVHPPPHCSVVCCFGQAEFRPVAKTIRWYFHRMSRFVHYFRPIGFLPPVFLPGRTRSDTRPARSLNRNYILKG